MTTEPSRIEFRVRGLDCAEEVVALRREVGPIIGGEQRLSFDLLQGRMSVDVGSTGTTADQVIRAAQRAGLRAEVWRPRPDDGPRESWWTRRGRTVLTIAGGAFALAGFLAQAMVAGGVRAALAARSMGTLDVVVDLVSQPGEAITLLRRVPYAPLYSLGILASVWPFLPKAWHALRRMRPDMNLLMTVAVVGATGIGEWLEAATVAFLFAVSLALESWSVGRARRGISALLDLAPPTVRVRRSDGAEELVPPDSVPPGTYFIVHASERIALDGQVRKGVSEVNQSPITGESAPAPKRAGDTVFAGTINGDGTLEVESTKAAADTTLASIVRMIGQSQARRAPSEQWVERFARVYTPVVMGLSLGVLLVPPLVGGLPWNVWIYNALVLLVIACPCALVISTPVSIVAGLASAARQGVLIKGGLFLEVPSRLVAVALDKTGTLTRGRPAVVEIIPLNGHTERELLERAAAMEARSTHPLGRAIVAYAGQRGVEPIPAEDFQMLPGKGATATFDGRRFWLGSHRYLEERGQETAEVHERLEALAGQGKTVVVVGNEQHVCGMIALADEVRPESFLAVTELGRAGIRHVVMLTGDNAPTARNVADAVGIDEFHAELLPADKVRMIESLVAKYGQVAMIGDGVNDAPAMARATLGIAMGAVGSDAAIETADVALMSDDLTRVAWLIRHSRRTLTVIRQNIAFALAVKLLFLILTIADAASLWSAIAADTGASLVVIFHGLRLIRPR